jgi:hypothetical protein
VVRRREGLLKFLCAERRVNAMLVANIGTLAAGGIVLGLALLACAAMLIAFRVQRSHGRWKDGGGD